MFELRRLLVLPTFGRVRKVAQPNGPSEKEGVVPSIDVTFLDHELRVSRGGDGSLFVLSRANEGDDGPMPLLDEAAELPVNAASTYDASQDVLPGSG